MLYRSLLNSSALPLIATLLLSSSAYAQDSSEADDLEPEEISESIVTTTARAPIESFAADRSIDVITSNDILASGATELSAIANELPGVSVQTTNRGGSTVSIRGMIGPENLIYVDGVRFNQSTFRTGPNQYLNTIDPWAIRRMEIMRGPGSVLYGSGAMGGVIHIFPHEVPDAPLALRGLGMFRTADTALGAALDVGGQPNNLGMIAGFSFRDYGQLHTGQRYGSNPTFLSAEQNYKMLASDYSEMYWRAATRADVGTYSSFRLNYMGGMVNDAPRTDNLGIGDVRFTDNRDDLLWATYTYAPGRGALSSLNANISFHRTHERTERYGCTTTTRPDGSAGRVFDPEACATLNPNALKSRRINDDIVSTIGASLTGVSQISQIPLRLSWGGEHYQDRVISEAQRSSGTLDNLQAQARGNFASGSTYASTGIFAHGDYSVFAAGPHEITLQGGARVENFRASEPAVNLLDEDIKFSNTGVVGSLGVSYLYDVNAHVYLNWSQGFRAPNLQEATYIGDSGNFFEINNPDLAPERSDTFELGTKVDLPAIAQVSAAAYVSFLSDRITRANATYNGQETVDGKTVQQRINADSAYYYGAELGLRSAEYFGLHLFGNISYIDGAVQTQSDDPNFKAGPLHSLFASGDFYENPRRLTPVEYIAGLGFSLDESWYASFFVEGAAAQDKLASGDLKDLRICETTTGVLFGDVNLDCPGSPSWTTFNVRGGYHFENIGRIDLTVENLTDVRYRHHASGTLAPGFGAMVTLTVLQ